MKRILAITLSIIMVFSLCACGNKETAKINCSSCGESISKDAAFCEHCGAAVNNEKTESEDTSSDNSSYTDSKTEETSKPSSSTTTPNTSKPSTPTHTHSYGNETITKKPTCTEPGIKTYYCLFCPATKIEQIDAVGHNWKDATCNSPKQCLECRTTEGNMLGHSYFENKCINCKNEKITFNYSWDEFPLKIEGNSPKTTVVTMDVKCYVENNAIYVECTGTSTYNCEMYFCIELLSSDEKKVASYDDRLYFFENKSVTRRECILSRPEFLSLEPGQYYPVIRYADLA